MFENIKKLFKKEEPKPKVAPKPKKLSSKEQAKIGRASCRERV